MARFKLQAGMEIDLLTRAEMRQELQGWQAELIRGITFRTLSGRVDKAAAWTMDSQAPGSGPLAPAAGMVWSLTRVAVAGNGLVLTADTFNLYMDAVGSGEVIDTGLLRRAVYDPGVVVINGPRPLIVTGAATGAGNDIFVSISVIEVPIQLAWQLL